MKNNNFKFKYKIIIIFMTIFIVLFFNLNFYYSYSDDILEGDYYDIPIIETSTPINNQEPKLNCRSCVVIDRITNTVLFGKNENNKVKMASTTKIMTCIIVLENGRLNDIVTVSKKAASVGGSKLGLKSNDKITVLNLLYGLMLCSGNDCAIALAEHIGGNVENFLILMNDKAKDLNLNNTNFESPHGLDSDNHFTTAYELALLTNYALKNDTFKSIVGTKNTTININGSLKNIKNTNELLGYLNGVYGVKTGFTNGANRCLVTACKRDLLDVICVVLGADTKKDRTKDSINLIEYTFNNYTYINLKEIVSDALYEWKINHIDYFKINKALNNSLDLQIDTKHLDYIPIKKEQVKSIKSTITIPDTLNAPIEKNTILGTMNISTNEESIMNLYIYNNNSIIKKTFSFYFYYLINNYTLYLEKYIK